MTKTQPTDTQPTDTQTAGTQPTATAEAAVTPPAKRSLEELRTGSGHVLTRVSSPAAECCQ